MGLFDKKSSTNVTNDIDEANSLNTDNRSSGSGDIGGNISLTIQNSTVGGAGGTGVDKGAIAQGSGSLGGGGSDGGGGGGASPNFGGVGGGINITQSDLGAIGKAINFASQANAQALEFADAQGTNASRLVGENVKSENAKLAEQFTKLVGIVFGVIAVGAIGLSLSKARRA